jgi:molybdenum cofactor guanylyltransferase
MQGIVLCGGQSSRMGTDKGLILTEAQTWVQQAVNKLSALNLPVKISVSEKQYKDYSELFSASDLITDDKLLVVKGPLLGVLSAHLQMPNEDLFVLACDMPLMDMAMLSKLLTIATNKQHFEAYTFSDNNELEPLCAIFTNAGLAKITKALYDGALHKHSMKFALSMLHTCAVPLEEHEKKYFQNFNAHSEINGLNTKS